MKKGYLTPLAFERIKTEKLLRNAVSIAIAVAILCGAACIGCSAVVIAKHGGLVVREENAVAEEIATEDATETVAVVSAVPAPIVLDVEPVRIGGIIDTGCNGSVERNANRGSGKIEQRFFDVQLAEEVQGTIFKECAKHGIDPAIIVGMCWRESLFRADAVGDNGHSFGLMQIQKRYHGERMERLGVDNLLDPVQNVTVGIDFIAELYGKYGDIEKALVCYNCGEYGAKQNFFNRGVYSSQYSRSVIEYANSLEVCE